MKDYSKAQFEANDAKAREAFKALTKDTIVVEGGKFEVDLICIRKDKSVYFVDVEVSSKAFKNMESFCYPKVNFLAKKKKYLELGEFYYILFSSDFKAYITGTSEVFKEEYLVQNITCTDNKGKKYLDDVYQVPKEQIYFRRL